MIQNRKFALAFRAGSFLFITSGILKQIGVFKGIITPVSFMFYTILSNILAILLFLILTVRTAKSLRESPRGDSGWYSRFEMVCVVDLLVTFIVYWVLLAPIMTSLWTFENITLHAIAPLLCLLDYVLFSKARCLKYRDVYFVCIFPLLYIAMISIAGSAGYVYWLADDGSPVHYPYFFLDYDSLGYTALAYIGAILIFFLLLSHCIYLVDRRLRRSLHTKNHCHEDEKHIM